MRTIDADALKKLKVYSEERHEYVVSVFNIDNAPTVEPDMAQVLAYESGKASNERPQGEWEEPFEWHGKTYHKCTNCHISSQLILINNYCPYCGAKMKGGAGMSKILYLCNGNRKGCRKIACGLYCRHTSDINAAANWKKKPNNKQLQLSFDYDPEGDCYIENEVQP